HDWIPPLEDFLRAAFKAEIPIVGICFGHQILAQALGGKVAKYDGGWTVGPTEYQMNGSKTMLNAWHQDQVIERPTGAKVIGTAAHCENAMLAYGYTALTIQAHPEISNSFVKGLVDGRGRGRVPDTLLDQALERLSEPIAQQAFATKMADFFKQPR
ncbi:MAG: GMP synthase-like glutamine amidotransferase, partial [Paracoccaceae bacterium]